MTDEERAREIVSEWHASAHIGWEAEHACQHGTTCCSTDEIGPDAVDSDALASAIAAALREARREAIEQAVLAVEKHDFLEECRLGVCDHGMGLPACLAAAVHAIVTLRGEGRPNA